MLAILKIAFNLDQIIIFMHQFFSTITFKLFSYLTFNFDRALQVLTLSLSFGKTQGSSEFPCCRSSPPQASRRAGGEQRRISQIVIFGVSLSNTISKLFIQIEPSMDTGKPYISALTTPKAQLLLPIFQKQLEMGVSITLPPITTCRGGMLAKNVPESLMRQTPSNISKGLRIMHIFGLLSQQQSVWFLSRVTTEEGSMMKSVPESRMIPYLPKLVEGSRRVMPSRVNAPISLELIFHQRSQLVLMRAVYPGPMWQVGSIPPMFITVSVLLVHIVKRRLALRPCAISAAQMASRKPSLGTSETPQMPSSKLFSLKMHPKLVLAEAEGIARKSQEVEKSRKLLSYPDPQLSYP